MINEEQNGCIEESLNFIQRMKQLDNRYYIVKTALLCICMAFGFNCVAGPKAVPYKTRTDYFDQLIKGTESGEVFYVPVVLKTGHRSKPVVILNELVESSFLQEQIRGTGAVDFLKKLKQNDTVTVDSAEYEKLDAFSIDHFFYNKLKKQSAREVIAKCFNNGVVMSVTLQTKETNGVIWFLLQHYYKVGEAETVGYPMLMNVE